ncbi:hypothetical protein RhiirA4_479179 [Rhizophagus irregularis]|uniref:Uncharacterized protein n=1 Tax=Rhizophagus irregularis TaxID=588596 RepID=A0A2I1HG08_9GLOM|nr:hypothetical protein RhiirA4_479179 [Rhizophagus irregularis]
MSIDSKGGSRSMNKFKPPSPLPIPTPATTTPTSTSSTTAITTTTSSRKRKIDNIMKISLPLPHNSDLSLNILKVLE